MQVGIPRKKEFTPERFAEKIAGRAASDLLLLEQAAEKVLFFRRFFRRPGLQSWRKPRAINGAFSPGSSSDFPAPFEPPFERLVAGHVDPWMSPL
jgi:hypothetical protein